MNRTSASGGRRGLLSRLSFSGGRPPAARFAPKPLPAALPSSPPAGAARHVAGEPVVPPPDVPRWARTAAHITAGITVPSGLWRVALVAGVPKVVPTIDAGPGERAYILSLSVMGEGLALATLGLVRPWGEVVPRWVPGLGGRPIPVMVPVTIAGAGSVATTAVCGYAAYQWAVRPPRFTRLQKTVVTACYAPLLAWGPLLGAVTASYYRRRTRQRSGA